MSDVNVKIQQCEADIAKLQETLAELKKQEEPQLKFGDVLKSRSGVRIYGYNASGELGALDRRGFKQSSAHCAEANTKNGYYVKGGNVFEDYADK